MSSQYKQRKQFNLHFTKVQTSSGKFKTTAKIVRITTTAEKQRGILHKVYNLKSRVTGDVPSVTNALNSMTPKTTQGKVALSVAKRTYKFTKCSVSTAFKAGMAAESVRLFVTDRISPYKQLQFNFTREQTADGKFKTKVNVVSNGTDFTRQRGVLHKVYHIPDRFKGDTFSLTKKLDSFQPKTTQGKVGLTAAKASYKFVKTGGKAVANTALGAENVALLAKDKAVGKYKQKLKEEMSNQDTSKGLLTVYGAGKGLVSHVNEKRAYHFEKKRLKFRKCETKLIDVQIKFGGIRQKKPLITVFRSNGKQISFGFKVLRASTFHIRRADNDRTRNRAKFKKIKTGFSSDKKKFKAQKKAYKSSRKSNISKAKIKRQKADFKAKKKDFKRNRKNFKKLDSTYKKRFKNQKKITKLSKPHSLASKSIGGITGAYANKLKEADSNNDFVTAATKAATIAKQTHGTVKTVRKKVASQRDSKFEKNINKYQGRLKEQEYKLKDKKKSNKSKNRRKRKSVKETLSQYVKDFIRSTATIVKSAVKDIGSKFLLAALPLLLLFIVGVGVVSIIISGLFSESGWIVGTYTADDEQLAAAVDAYTLHARNLNQAVVQCGETNNWKTGLKAATDSSYDDKIKGYKETPNTGNFYYGKSTKLNYEPAEYDFDPYILWSFLSAYYYDFDKAEECRNNGTTYSPEYWEVTGETEDLLKELFDLEYTFEFRYINESHWVNLDRYELRPTPTVESDGSISYSYHTIYSDSLVQHSSSGSYSYTEFKYRNAPSEIQKFADNKYIHFNENTLEILDAKNDNAHTGWYLQEQTISILGEFSDGSVNWRSSFYYSDQYGDLCWGSEGNPRTMFFWGEIGQPSFQEILWCVSPPDTYSWNSNLTDMCLVSYYQKSEWKKEVSLYYNVKRNCSFQEAAAQMLSNTSYASERLEYFMVLVGDAEHNYKGNHQCLKSPVNDSMSQLIENGRIYNGYGYDVDEWNSTHCNIKYDHHNGLDISCSVSEPIYAMVDGEVTNIDGDSITIVSMDKVLLYSGTYAGNTDKFQITITYKNVSPMVNAGDTVGAGDVIGNVTDSKQCDNTNNSNFATEYIHITITLKSNVFNKFYTDPRLLIY